MMSTWQMISQYDKQTHFVYCYKRISIYYDYDCVEICATLVCNSKIVGIS